MSVKEELIKFAERFGYEIKKDEAMFDQMEHNKEMFGFPVCPCCFIPKGEPIKTSTLIKLSCPCVAGIAKLESDGSCMCGVFTLKMDNEIESLFEVDES